ncbi:MAG: helix-turn-helix domain-containing protein [Candidatus Binatia bacterium]
MYGNCSVFARKPTRGEARRLQGVARSTDRNLRDRALCVLLSAQEYGVPEICQKLARGLLYVIRWIRRFNAHGSRAGRN